jgi:uncharacterized protein YutE (UPF0331/DUF86 family)
VSPSKLQAKVIAERIAWIRAMMDNIRSLPFDSFDSFVSDRRNIAAVESYLRRGLEALLDLGRHIMAKGFGRPVVEYKEIAHALRKANVLDEDKGNLLGILAGYRNRMVHFYHEISDRELYEICTSQLGDIEALLESLKEWIKAHPEMIDEAL